MKFDCLIPPTPEPAEPSSASSLLSFPPLFLFFPLPSFCTPGTPKFSALSNCGSTYIHPKCSARKKKDFQFMTMHLFWVLAITHMEKNPTIWSVLPFSSSLHSTADSFTIFKVRLTIYKKAEREGVDLIISQLGIGLAHKLLKTVSTLHNHNLRGRKKALKYRRPLGTLLFYFILFW